MRRHPATLALALGLALAAGPARAVFPLADIPLATNVYTAAEVDARIPLVYYGTSATAAGTQDKVVVCPSWPGNASGAILYVRFANNYTYNGQSYLVVNGAARLPIYSMGATAAVRYQWRAGETVGFVCTGTGFEMIDGAISSTTYYGTTKLSSATNSTSAALSATPAAVKLVRDEIGNESAARVAAIASSTNALAAMIPSLLGSPYVHLGSTVVEDSAWSASFVGGGSYSAGTLWVMPESQTRDDGVFCATITSTNWIVDLEGQAVVTAYTATQEPSAAPTSYHVSRVDGHTYTITATNVTPSYAATPPYFMRIDGFRVLTYNRPAYTPNATTNDAAALPSFVDTYPIASTSTPARIVANAAAVRAYVDARKAEIAKAAWGYTPAGNAAQPGAVTLDLPTVYRGSFSWIVAGNAAAISADGGDWVADADGSYFQIGLGGRADFRLTATDQQLRISDMQWSGTGANATVSLDVPVSQLADPSTPPTIRYIDSLVAPFDWMDCTEQVSSRVSSVWRCTVSGSLANVRFFSAWAPQGSDRAYIRAPLELDAGEIVIDGESYSPHTVTIGGTAYKILAAPQ